MAAGQPAKKRQVRTPERRKADSVHNEIAAQLRGQRGHTDDRVFDVGMPFGVAKYRYGSLTPIGSNGVHIPDRVDVNFTRELSAPVRTMRLEVRQGVPVCTELHMVSKPQGRGVRPADLQSVDLTAWIENVFSECIWRLDDAGQLKPEPGSALGRKAIRDAVKPGRHRVSRELLELAADVYRRNIGGRPNESVQEALCVPPRTAARYIQMCRADEYQLLPPTTKGKRKA